MGCQNFPEMINFWSTFLLCLSSIRSFSKKSKQLFSSRYCGSRNFCKKHDIIKPNFYTILHNLASSTSILKYTSSAYVCFWIFCLLVPNMKLNCVRHIIFQNKCPFISWYAKVAKICEIILSLKFHLFVKFLRLTFFRK